MPAPSSRADPRQLALGFELGHFEFADRGWDKIRFH